MREIALFSGKIYTAGTNFTRPLRLRQISTLTYLSTSPKMTIIKSSKCHCSSQSFSINRLSRSIFSCSLHTLLVICIYSYNPTRCPKNREVAIWFNFNIPETFLQKYFLQKKEKYTRRVRENHSTTYPTLKRMSGHQLFDSINKFEEAMPTPTPPSTPPAPTSPKSLTSLLDEVNELEEEMKRLLVRISDELVVLGEVRNS